MKTVKINRKKMIELENAKNFAQIIDDTCMFSDCAEHTVIEYLYETKKERRIYHACSECGNVEKINT